MEEIKPIVTRDFEIDYPEKTNGFVFWSFPSFRKILKSSLVVLCLIFKLLNKVYKFRLKT